MAETTSGETVRERALDLKRMPIIALTIDRGYDACLKAGMDDFLSKPCDKRKIGEVLRRWLAGPSRAPSRR